MRSVVKRLTAVVCAGIMLFAVLSFGFVGCGDAEKKRIEELETELSECNDALKEYFDGEILTLEKAYKLKLISYDDLLSIAYYHNDGNEYNEDIMPKNFTPKPKTPDRLGDEYTELLKKKLEKRARAYFTEKYFQEEIEYYEKNGLPVETYDYEEYMTKIMSYVEITRYYGMYNGCVAMMYHSYGNYGVTGDMKYENIDGVTLCFNSGMFNIDIWVFK